MGKTKGLNNAEFEVGAEVRIADRAFLEEFLEAGQYHNELEPEQLELRRPRGQGETSSSSTAATKSTRSKAFPACGTKSVSAPPERRFRDAFALAFRDSYS